MFQEGQLTLKRGKHLLVEMTGMDRQTHVDLLEGLPVIVAAEPYRLDSCVGQSVLVS